MYVKHVERAKPAAEDVEADTEDELGVEEASRMLHGAFKKLMCMRLCQEGEAKVRVLRET